MKKLGSEETERLLKKHKIPYLEQHLARTLSGAARTAETLGYPVAIKIASKEILHKTEVDGVALNIRDEPELKRAYNRMMNRLARRRLKARVDGVYVQKMLAGRNWREVIIGSKRDEQFGPVLMFGLGGVFVEVLKDVSFRLVPIGRKDAREMISEVKGRKVLEAFRGRKPVSFRELEDCLLRVSRMVEKEGIEELDINPLMVNHREAFAVDVRVFVG